MTSTLRPKVAAAPLLFCLIFGLAFCLRQFTFWLPHWQGDQSQYVILAMKLGAQTGAQTGLRIDFSDYNLRGIDTEVVRIDDAHKTQIIFPHPSVSGASGSVMNAYKHVGLGFLDIPFFYRAPLLPALLAVSHHYLAPKDQPFAVVKNNLGRKVLEFRPPLYLKTQFWAAVIPFASSLLVLLFVYLWTRRVFGEATALTASFILAVNPIAILTANRIWTEDLATFFLMLAVVVYRSGLRLDRAWIGLAAGTAAGLAVLANQKALLAVAGLGLYTFIAVSADSKKSGNPITRVLTCMPWWSFLAGLAAVTFKWFWTVYRHYGSPFWQPESFDRMIQGRDIAPSGVGVNLQAWYDVLLHQPHGVIYYVVGTAAICWPFAAGYLTVRDAWKSTLAAVARRAWDERPVFLWCWIFGFAVFFLPHRVGEYRYLSLAYPALAVLSGWMCVRAAGFLSRFTARPWIARAAVAVFLIASAFYSAGLVFPVLWEQKNLITAPWN